MKCIRGTNKQGQHFKRATVQNFEFPFDVFEKRTSFCYSVFVSYKTCSASFASKETYFLALVYGRFNDF